MSFKIYHTIDDLTPRIVVLKHFATGGTVSIKEAIARTGLKSKDLFGFVSYQGITYHTLTVRAQERTYQEFDEIDFHNEIDEVITSGKKILYDELGQYLERKRPAPHPIFAEIKAINDSIINESIKNCRPKQKT